ncbi:MAG: hypothetical protein J6T10_03290 [Methanobrevibacter sp.]|nr:hypothetical protein [Methanobrevibacter sp.]
MKEKRLSKNFELRLRDYVKNRTYKIEFKEELEAFYPLNFVRDIKNVYFRPSKEKVESWNFCNEFVTAFKRIANIDDCGITFYTSYQFTYCITFEWEFSTYLIKITKDHIYLMGERKRLNDFVKFMMYPSQATKRLHELGFYMIIKEEQE